MRVGVSPDPTHRVSQSGLAGLRPRVQRPRSVSIGAAVCSHSGGLEPQLHAVTEGIYKIFPAIFPGTNVPERPVSANPSTQAVESGSDLLDAPFSSSSTADHHRGGTPILPVGTEDYRCRSESLHGELQDQVVPCPCQEMPFEPTRARAQISGGASTV